MSAYMHCLRKGPRGFLRHIVADAGKDLFLQELRKFPVVIGTVSGTGHGILFAGQDDGRHPDLRLRTESLLQVCIPRVTLDLTGPVHVGVSDHSGEIGVVKGLRGLQKSLLCKLPGRRPGPPEETGQVPGPAGQGLPSPLCMKKVDIPGARLPVGIGRLPEGLC